MNTVANKHILLDVADEVEKDEHYSGESYWFPQRDCGCAMVRIIGRGGEYDKEAATKEGFDRIMPFRIEGYPNIDGENYALNVEGGVAHLTNLSQSVWQMFLSFSLKADRFWTAKALREIAENGDFRVTLADFKAEYAQEGKVLRIWGE